RCAVALWPRGARCATVADTLLRQVGALAQRTRSRPRGSAGKLAHATEPASCPAVPTAALFTAILCAAATVSSRLSTTVCPTGPTCHISAEHSTTTTVKRRRLLASEQNHRPQSGIRDRLGTGERRDRQGEIGYEYDDTQLSHGPVRCRMGLTRTAVPSGTHGT